jgi:hypothetical protein
MQHLLGLTRASSLWQVAVRSFVPSSSPAGQYLPARGFRRLTVAASMTIPRQEGSAPQQDPGQQQQQRRQQQSAANAWDGALHLLRTMALTICRGTCARDKGVDCSFLVRIVHSYQLLLMAPRAHPRLQAPPARRS